MRRRDTIATDQQANRWQGTQVSHAHNAKEKRLSPQADPGIALVRELLRTKRSCWRLPIKGAGMCCLEAATWTLARTVHPVGVVDRPLADRTANKTLLKVDDRPQVRLGHDLCGATWHEAEGRVGWLVGWLEGTVG